MNAAYLQAALRDLAALKPGAAPFISLYLDLRVGGDGQRPGLTFLRSALATQARLFGARAAARASFDADVERILAYLVQQAEASDNGVAIFACHAREFFHAIPLAVAPENHLTVAQAPRLYQLAQVLDDYETYCVAVLDRTRFRIFTVALGDLHKVAEKHQHAFRVSKTLAGGWAQARYQRHVDQNIERFVEEAAAATATVLDRLPMAHLVVAGETVAVTALKRVLHERLPDKAVTVLNADADVPEHELLTALRPLIAAAERSSEAATVAGLESAAAEHNLAALGAEAVLVALERGQVDKLVMSTTFAEQGWRCLVCLSYGTGGSPERCPYCEGGVIATALREAMTGAAERTGAAIEIVQDSAHLDRLGGVGAYLRYPLS